MTTVFFSEFANPEKTMEKSIPASAWMTPESLLAGRGMSRSVLE
jgi:hypothetical protein